VPAIIGHSRSEVCSVASDGGAGGTSRENLGASPNTPEHARTAGSKILKLLGVLALIACLCGCQRSSHEHLEDARQGLADAAYAEAIAAAEAGLRGAPSPRTEWGLELVKLEAHARSGHGAEAKAQLEKLAGRHPRRIPATEYAATAHQLRSADQGAAAIEVLDLGMQRYPGNPVIEKMIGESASAGVDSAELELLRTLGYIE